MFRQGVKNTDFVNFLKEYNRYEAQIFRVHQSFDGFSDDISHFVLGQKFTISICLRMVLTIDFLEDAKRHDVQIFRVSWFFYGLSNDR